MAEQKQKKNGGNALLAILLILFSLGAGYLLGSSGIFGFSDDAGPWAVLGMYLLQIILLLLSFPVQTVIHEAGHLIAGLMTGYRFSSFRIGSLMLLKTKEGYSFKRFTLAGTSGQCLLIPPEKGPDGKYPYRLYHLGGVLANLITAVLFLVLFLLIPGKNAFTPFFMYLAVAGTLAALTNGLPMHVGGIANDGYNVIHLEKDPFALEVLWLQLKINERQTEGVRLKDLPEEWFRIPENASKTNMIISSIEVFSEERAMDALDFRLVKEKIAALENTDEYVILDLYKNLLLFDKITVDLIENGEKADVSALNDPKIQAFRKIMAKYPAVIRTEYAISLLKNHDAAAAKKYQDALFDMAGQYPMPSDIASETEIMAYAASRAEQMP